MYTIVGGGFGLYGYFPAIVQQTGMKVLLNEKYRKTITSRPELNRFYKKIIWCESLTSALHIADGIIIATPPTIQAKLIDEILAIENISRVVLEKPIATTPNYGKDILRKFYDKKKRLRLGYTFMHTNWYGSLRESIPSISGVKIHWSFKAHHIENNIDSWKRYHENGGGPLRFYGIHLIALLTSLGFDKALTSIIEGDKRNEFISWKASFENKGACRCEVTVQINCYKTSFAIDVFDQNKEPRCLFYGQSPFDDVENNLDEDSRLPVLRKLISSFDEDDSLYLRLYDDANTLWMNIENTTDYIVAK
jgi:hypothetical protein